MPEAPLWLDILGARVHARAWGSGPTLIGLHGLGGGAHFFQALGLGLADRYRTLALDFPGSGLSPALPSTSFEVLGAMVVELARRQPSAPVAILGHSMGTIVALEAIRQVPGLTRGLVAIGGLPVPLTESRERIAARADAIARSGLMGLGEEVAAANLSRRTLIEQPALAALFGRLFEMQSPDGYVATARALADWPTRPLPSLGEATCLLVSGDEDRYAPPAAMRQFQAALPPATELELMPDCGHLPFLERPAEFSAIVRRFLDQLEPQNLRT